MGINDTPEPRYIRNMTAIIGAVCGAATAVPCALLIARFIRSMRRNKGVNPAQAARDVGVRQAARDVGVLLACPRTHWRVLVLRWLGSMCACRLVSLAFVITARPPSAPALPVPPPPPPPCFCVLRGQQGYGGRGRESGGR